MPVAGQEILICGPSKNKVSHHDGRTIREQEKAKKNFEGVDSKIPYSSPDSIL